MLRPSAKVTQMTASLMEISGSQFWKNSRVSDDASGRIHS
jgi:hypothetical protein